MIGIADEAAFAVLRTSFSHVVREANDYACGLVSAGGLGICENSQAIPGFAGSMARTLRRFLQVYPPQAWAEGDLVVTNDPWDGTGHLPDFTTAAPVFHRGRLVAFATSIAHVSDISGLAWSADGRDVFEEGLRVPITRLYRRGKINRVLAELLEANLRLPEDVWGDLEALRIANRVCARRLVELMEEERLSSLEPFVAAIQARADSVMRQAIRAMPDGTYRGEVEIDGIDTPLTIRTTVTVARDDLTVDYTGTSGQVGRAINCPYVSSFAHTAYAIKMALDPLTPRTEGSYRAIRMLAPEGTLVNPRFPAAVAARQVIVQYVNAPIWTALSQAIPDRVIAQSGAPNVQIVYSGQTAEGKRFTVVPFPAPGVGARPTKDGLSATGYPSNAGSPPVEVMESSAPVVFWEKALVADTGGAGRFRGGLGQRVRVEARSPFPTQLAVMADRIQHAAQGFLGGEPGSCAFIRRPDGRVVPSKGTYVLEPGGILEFQTAGGGGYGPPRERDRARVLDDVRSGYVSAAAAREVYGVDMGEAMPHTSSPAQG
jgi:N-methylhydantoinase B